MPLPSPDLAAETVLQVVREHWDAGVVTATLVPLGDDAHHWVAAGRHRPRWFVRADDVRRSGRLEVLLDAYAAARELAARGHHVVVPTIAPGSGHDPGDEVDGSGVGVVVGGSLVTVTAYLDGAPGPGEYADDEQRTLLAGALGALHAAPPPVRTPTWRPGPRGRGELDAALASGAAWTAGPFGGSVRGALRDNESHLRMLYARYDALALRAEERRAGWVPTHGTPHTGHVLWLAGGPVLVGWGTLRLAPRERDLRAVLRGADGAEPLSAYTARGGSPDLDADLVELFDLEAWLGAVAHHALYLRGPLAGEGDERLRDALLEELAAG